MRATRTRQPAGAVCLAIGLAALLARAAASEPGGAATHWPLPPAALEEILAREDFEIREVGGGVGGVMGVKKLRLHFPGAQRELKVKWKVAPPGTADGWNNTPRKEIAAYEIQKWFLDPEDYVVPTIVARCIPLATYAPLAEGAEPQPNLPGTRCVFGGLTIWMEHVGIEDPIYEEARFRANPRYAHHMANLNLLTYLIQHQDGRRNNFLTADDKSDRHIFSIDNGVAFGARVTNWFVWNWDAIRVPALRRQSIERLRALPPERVEGLGVVAELRAGEDGVLRAVAPSANADLERGARVAPGWLQLGLTQSEIAALRARLERLLADADSGRLPLF
jgi:hypothetical protein